MLDDLKFIHQRDGQDALGVAEKQWQQLQHTYTVTISPPQQIANIVLGGMGGSGWPALYMKAWAGLKVPFEIVNDYNLPEYVGCIVRSRKAHRSNCRYDRWRQAYGAGKGSKPPFV
jgi:hypothetical protein